jgi:hypothetical protein
MLIHLPQEALLYDLFVRMPVEFDEKQETTSKRSKSAALILFILMNETGDAAGQFCDFGEAYLATIKAS